LNKLINNYKDLDFKALISLEELKRLQSLFNAPKIIDIRDRLIVLRDKFYAHFDREKLEKEVNIQLAEIDVILSLLKDFISEIKSKVFSSQIDFDNDIFININEVLECIDESNKRYYDEIIRKYNEESKEI
jgi:transcriptional regulator NrdR family protein